AMKNCVGYHEVLFACWHAGLVAVPMNAKLHPKEFAYILENSEAKACFVTPDLESAIPQGIPVREIEKLRGMPAPITERQPDDGAPMYVADSLRAIQLFGQRLYQLYGQGEAPMTITGLPQEMHQASMMDKLSSCGYARTGCEVKIFDDADRELPAGEIGEIVTRSDCVMAGYWQNPEATKKTLRGGWLHTGDV